VPSAGVPASALNALLRAPSDPAWIGDSAGRL